MRNECERPIMELAPRYNSWNTPNSWDTPNSWNNYRTDLQLLMLSKVSTVNGRRIVTVRQAIGAELVRWILRPMETSLNSQLAADLHCEQFRFRLQSSPQPITMVTSILPHLFLPQSSISDGNTSCTPIVFMRSHTDLCCPLGVDLHEFDLVVRWECARRPKRFLVTRPAPADPAERTRCYSPISGSVFNPILQRRWNHCRYHPFRGSDDRGS